MTQIHPVILCGGSGTRLWPLSREAYPKQFVPLTGSRTLFQASALRVWGGGAGLDFARPIVLTKNDFRFIVAEQLQAVGIDPGSILIEPEGRNTGPAVLAAALRAYATDPEAILLVLPSDHVIPDAQAFRAAVSRGLPAVAAGDLVTFGIAPDRPETGYGYLELAARLDGGGAPVKLKRFVEKPDAASAEAMLAEGRHLWNAGIFPFAAKDMLAAFDTHAPDLVGPVRAALDEAESDLGFCRIAPYPWAKVRNVSIDYAVMEKAANLSVVPLMGAWSDLGSWEAVLRVSTPDAEGVATSGEATAIDCRNSLLRSENEDLELVGLGLDGIIAVATPDAVLVADASRAQDVRLAVDALKRKGAKQATAFPRDHRPWGFFETLALSDRFQVKRIVVKPGAALSLQSHVHRSEHWIIVSGTAKVTVDDKVSLVTENESIYVPLGAVHRMENPGKVPMVLIEVQTGAYLGEDDIVRYEDVYARGQGAKG
jgi:mannose-1-phosphate guanylyltransferase/mannose-1-phosphate guanylyltransferase/mannose-6-phosphate isomerase